MGGDGGVGHRADRAGAAAPQASAGNAYGRDQKAARRRLPVRDREPPSGPSQMPPVSGFGPGGDLSGIWSGGWSGLSIAWTAMALAGQLCYLTPRGPSLATGCRQHSDDGGWILRPNSPV